MPISDTAYTVKCPFDTCSVFITKFTYSFCQIINILPRNNFLRYYILIFALLGFAVSVRQAFFKKFLIKKLKFEKIKEINNNSKNEYLKIYDKIESIHQQQDNYNNTSKDRFNIIKFNGRLRQITISS